VVSPDRCADADPTPGVLKLMLDTNVIDALMADQELVSLLRSAVDNSTLELLITHVQIDEVMNTGSAKRAKREALVQMLATLPAKRVPTYGVIPDLSRFDNAIFASDAHAATLLEMTGGNTRHNEDALIVLTAAWFFADVVSENIKDVPKMAAHVGIASYRTEDLRRVVGNGPRA
jgi:hypothetical protein